jgi:lysophospholipase L1-like esterase
MSRKSLWLWMLAGISLTPWACPAAGTGTVQTVLCIGDSITEWDRGWVKWVGQNGQIDTINAGKGGRQTAAAVETFQKAAASNQPFDRVIFFLGVNDLPGRNPLPADKKVTACVKSMGQALDLALTRLPPKDVILVSPCSVNAEVMRQPSQTDPTMTARRERNVKKGYDICQPILEDLEAAYRKLAAEKGVPFLSLLNVVSPDNFPDGLHPSEAGQRQIADVIIPFLLKNQGTGK